MTERRLKAMLYAAPLVLLVLFTALGFAQTSPAAPGQSQSAKGKHVSSQSSDFGTQLARESREAAGEEKGETEELKKSPSVRYLAKFTGMSMQHAYWLGVALNFVGIGLVVAAVVKWGIPTLIPAIGAYLRARTGGIRSGIEEAQKASEDANRRLAEIESRLAKLDAEIAAMQSTAEQEADAEEARIQAAAEEDVRKIAEAVRQEIAAAAKAARRDLKVYAADLAVALAQRQIRVDKPTDQALVRSFADQLGRETNGTGRKDRD